MVDLESAFHDFRPRGSTVSTLHYVSEEREIVSVRRGRIEPVHRTVDEKIRLTVEDELGFGYAITRDVSRDGLYLAFHDARAAQARDEIRAPGESEIPSPCAEGGPSETPVDQPWSSWSPREMSAYLLEADRQLGEDPRVIDTHAFLEHIDRETLSLSSEGDRRRRRTLRIVPGLVTLARKGQRFQRRSLGGPGGIPCPGGLEVLEELRFLELAERLRREAIQLLDAPLCPTTTWDLVLGPFQLLRQSHDGIDLAARRASVPLSLDDLVRCVHRGVLMDGHLSASVDGAGFWFTCEWGRLIEDGALTSWVRAPGYRGRTDDFWTRLDRVADATTRELGGIASGAAGASASGGAAGRETLAGLFRDVEVFGAEDGEDPAVPPR